MWRGRYDMQIATFEQFALCFSSQKNRRAKREEDPFSLEKFSPSDQSLQYYTVKSRHEPE